MYLDLNLNLNDNKSLESAKQVPIHFYKLLG